MIKGYVAFSVGIHGAFIAVMLLAGTLLSKPRMSYYSVDLFSSLPAGSPGGGGAAATSMAPEPAPAIKQPSLPPVPLEEDERPVTKEAIKLGKKKKLPPAKVVPKATTQKPFSKPRTAREPKYTYGAEDSEGTSRNAGTGTGTGVPGGAGGLGIVAEAGPAFPYPWYLKAIADKLDRQWNPPQEFQSDTLCQIAFTIDRGGEISGTKIEKASGESLFDQLAMRAVLYANPLPPLPTGFPDETLRVHMKFVGKR